MSQLCRILYVSLLATPELRARHALLSFNLRHARKTEVSDAL